MQTQRAQQSAFSAAKWMTGSSYVAFVSGFTSSIFITRALGPEAYGLYAYLIWMVGLAVSLTTGGLNVTAIRFISEALGGKKPEEAHALFWWLRRVLWVGMALMSLALLTTTLFPQIYPQAIANKLYLYLGFALTCSLLKSAYMFDISVSKGYAIFYTEALSTSIIGLSSTALSGLFYFTHQSLDAYLLLFLAASVAHPLIAQLLMRKHALIAQAGDLPKELKVKVLRTLGWNSAFTLVGMLSTKSIDIYLLGIYALPAHIGYYNVASSLSKAGLDLLSNGFSSVLLPFISRAGAEGGKEKVQLIFSRSVRFYQFVGIIVAAGAYLLSESLVTLLYGEAYREAIPALRIMALVGGILLPNAAFSAVFIATDSHRARMLFIFLSSSISLVTSFAFIPWMGYRGALISVFLGNVVTYVIVAASAHFMLDIRFPVRSVFLQWLCAGIPFSLLAWLLPAGDHIVLAVLACLVFGVSYIVLSVNLGAWEESDLLALRENSPRMGRMLSIIHLRQAPLP